MAFLMGLQVISLLVIGALALIVFALARQIGILHERLAPIGATQTQPGLDIGSALPRIVMRTLEGGSFPVGEHLGAGRRQMLLFITSDCPICRRVTPIAVAMARDGLMDLVLIGDGTPPELHALREAYATGDTPLVTGPELGLVLQVSRLPFAAVVDDHGTLRAKGLVNTRAHLENMLASAGSMPGKTAARAEESLHAAI
ncbi:hypothetical protein AA103196_2159 [Ameyamaea chiangmaiensis NBRC 103196]|nr:hypothetical protein AA103196_2159 [Ameyamaea chiangmaiensis NBRC 103196]